MPKQASQVCISFFIVLLLSANYRISAKPSDQSYAPAAAAALESANKSVSLESLPVLPNPDSRSEAGALSPTNVSFPPSPNIPDVETKSNVTLYQSPPSVNDPNLKTKGDQNVSTSLSPSNVDNSVLDTLKADPPAVETKESSSEDVFQKNTSLPLSPRVDVPAVETKANQTLSQGEENLSQKLAPPPSVNDPNLETKGDKNISTTSLSPTNVDNSPRLDVPAVATKENQSVSQQNLSSEETKGNQTVPQQNLSSEETKGNQTLAQDNTYVPSSPPIMGSPGVEKNKSPALETSNNGSFTQENQSPVTYVNNAPASLTAQDHSPATPNKTETQNPENVPQLNNSSLPKTSVPSPLESFPESAPTIQMTPSKNDNNIGLAPTSHPKILPFNYRAEDEPVEPYDEEEDSWKGRNGAMAGILVGACVIGVGGFVYQKKKNEDNIRAQYHCLAKKGGV